MALFKAQPPSLRATDEPDPLAVPEHLRPFWASAAGPTEAEQHNYFRSPPQEITLHPPGAFRRADEEPEPLVEVPFEVWAHRIRVRNAAYALAAKQAADTVAALMTACDLCGRSDLAGSLAHVDHDGHTLRLCHGDCVDLVRQELHRRRHADRLDQLLTDAPLPR